MCRFALLPTTRTYKATTTPSETNEHAHIKQPMMSLSTSCFCSNGSTIAKASKVHANFRLSSSIDPAQNHVTQAQAPETIKAPPTDCSILRFIPTHNNTQRMWRQCGRAAQHGGALRTNAYATRNDTADKHEATHRSPSNMHSYATVSLQRYNGQRSTIHTPADHRI